MNQCLNHPWIKTYANDQEFKLNDRICINEKFLHSHQHKWKVYLIKQHCYANFYSFFNLFIQHVIQCVIICNRVLERMKSHLSRSKFNSMHINHDSYYFEVSY